MAHELNLSDIRRALLDRYRRGELVEGISSAILRKGNEGTGPLSLSQEQLWIHSRIASDLPLYNEPVTVTRQGPLNIAVLQRSFTEIVRRHEAWRTTFDSGHGVPLQTVHPPPDVQFHVADLRGWPSQDREAEALRLATADARRAFDLTRGPLVRPLLVRMADDEHRLYLSLHQIIFDGVSMYTVFLPELTSLYEAFAKGQTSPLSPLSIQYGDFAEWQRQSAQAAVLPVQLAYWKKQLQDAPAVLELSTDRARPPTQSFRGAQRTFAFSPSLTHSLRALSQAEGVTLFVTLLSGFKALLFRYTGQDDIVVGTVTTTRKRTELQSLLGFFLNTLALRTSLAGDPTFRELLRRVREVTLDALCHADVPIHHVVQAVQPNRDPSRNPLFQVMFVLEPPLPPPPIGWNLTQMDVDTGISRVDLYFELDERREGLIGRIRYNTDLFDAASIDVMQQHFEALLNSVVARPEERISRLPLISCAVRGRTIRHPLQLTTDFEEFTVEAIEQTIHQRFERQVEKCPSKVALRTAHEEWTRPAQSRSKHRGACDRRHRACRCRTRRAAVFARASHDCGNARRAEGGSCVRAARSGASNLAPGGYSAGCAVDHHRHIAPVRSTCSSALRREREDHLFRRGG